MATIKSYTDIEQSRKLAEILPLESADMCYIKHASSDNPNYEFNEDFPPMILGNVSINEITAETLPCWSLAALLNIIPTTIGSVFEKDALRLRIDKSETDFNIWYDNLDTNMVEEGFDIIKTNPIDACYEMILKLNELKML